MTSTGPEQLMRALQRVPAAEREALFARAHQAIVLGIRAAVLDGLAEEDRAEFERIVLEEGEAELLAFGKARISGFDAKMNAVFERTVASLEADLRLR